LTDAAPKRAARIRAFVALELEARAREAIGLLQARLRGSRGLRLVRPEGVHLTLRFLGSSEPAQLEALAPRLASAAAACPPFETRVGGLGTFPERGAPRVLWLRIELPPSALELQCACEQAAREAGFEAEDRPFAPHLTLGRWRERVPRPSLEPAELGATRIESLVLFRSETRRDGAAYTPLRRFALGGSA
jgi:RNA 2',3'-cyclic 3'-phosphodiesterase